MSLNINFIEEISIIDAKNNCNKNFFILVDPFRELKSMNANN